MRNWKGTLLCALILFYACSTIIILSSLPYINYPQRKFRSSLHEQWHPTSRETRFPSVDERVQLYMANWYQLPCPHVNQTSKYYSFERHDRLLNFSFVRVRAKNNIQVDFPEDLHVAQAVVLNKGAVEQCATPWRIFRSNTQSLDRQSRRQKYRLKQLCEDVLELLELMQQEYTTDVPALVLMAEGDIRHPIPIFGKWRWATTRKRLNEDVLSPQCDGALPQEFESKDPYPPILWKMGTQREWEMVERVQLFEIPWEKKIRRAVWRGVVTGSIGDEASAVTEEGCKANNRCRFVLQHGDSKLVDAGFTAGVSSRDRINGVALLRWRAHMRDVLKHKIVISLEGDHARSDLKWQLMSSCVLLMAPPKQTSWLMEEYLQPWVHYIPLADDASNALEMVKWVLQNDGEAHRIAERATLFMYDLLYHPEAYADELAIKTQIVQRYQQWWSPGG